jgi:hypothetical protein
MCILLDVSKCRKSKLFLHEDETKSQFSRRSKDYLLFYCSVDAKILQLWERLFGGGASSFYRFFVLCVCLYSPSLSHAICFSGFNARDLNMELYNLPNCMFAWLTSKIVEGR